MTLGLNEYQERALGTNICPRVYTEDQVRRILAASFEELDEGVVLSEEEINNLLDDFETPFCRLVYPVLGLLGEAGEIANKLKKVARDDDGFLVDPTAMAQETGDVMLYTAAVASALTQTLEGIGQNNLRKLADRKARGVLAGSGDNR